jgi:hypothetical protein
LINLKHTDAQGMFLGEKTDSKLLMLFLVPVPGQGRSRPS